MRRVVAGGVQVNGPTYGFEPHVPFGGEQDSGTGWREPGTEALDVYSDWKTVYVTHDPAGVSSVVALVPAKATSQRLPGKNICPLGGHPLIAYTIASAREADLFTEVVVSTEIGGDRRRSPSGTAATVRRAPDGDGDPMSPDIEWVLHAMSGRGEDAFAILRPDEPVPHARRRSGARGSASSSSATVPTRSAPSSPSASTRGRCGSSTAT